MADNNRIKSIALVGASGNIGSSILHALITSSHSYHITIITRSDSTSTFSKFPPSKSTITIKQGSYADPAFLSTAFQGADAAIFALHFMAMGVQGQMIEAAAKVGVKWILPTEYAGDGLNESMVEAVPLFHPKREARRQIEELSKKYEGLRWIGVATGPWLEASIQRSLFALNPHSRTATLYHDAGPFNTVTLSHAGLAIAGLLALPLINPSNPRASLSHYANNFLYTSSFHTTQERIFESLQRATGTQEEDWKVDRSKTIEEWAGVCREGMKKGDMRMGAGLTFAYYMGEGWGGDVETKAKEDREVLGLTEEEEDFDEAVKRAVEAGEPAPLNFGK